MLHFASERDDALADGVMHDYTKAGLSPRLEAILNFATLLTRDPSSVQEADLAVLHGEGLGDEEILSVVLITCVFNFMTRLADGLGVELDQRMDEYVRTFMRPAEEDELDWLRRGKATIKEGSGG